LVEAGLHTSAVTRRVKAGRLIPILPGVFKVPYVPEAWEQKVVAALLWAKEAVASHRSAARLWGLLDDRSSRVDITTTARMKSPVPWLIVHQVAELHGRDRRTYQGIAMTTPERTLMDLGAVATETDLEEALEASIRLGLTTFDRIVAHHAVSGGNGRRGSAALGRLLAERGDQPSTGSRFETLLNRMLRAAKMRLPERQHPVFIDGEFVGRVDFAYPSARVAIEADSWRHHFGREPWQNDSHRTTDLSAFGWAVLRFTYADLRDRPAWVIQRIRDSLGGQLFR
jgi:very-short-patch-repair endonuclease